MNGLPAFAAGSRLAGRCWLWLSLCVSTLAQAQMDNTTVNLTYLEGTVPVAPDAVTTLGADLFGDKVNLFNGALHFEQLDAQLPGNSALPVAISRRYQPGRSFGIRGQFGDWDLDTPRMGGVFSTHDGWTVTSSALQSRCSNFALPPTTYAPPAGGLNVVAVNFIATDFHQGVHIQGPGMPGQEVLRRAPGYSAAPGDVTSYPLVTREQWQISCLPSIQNGPGEGFLAVSPEGVKYRFDWMSVRWTPDLTKDSAVISRREIFLHASEVTDRFGNWVRYRYDPANPLLLTQVESSDGRVITISNAGGVAVSVNDGSRIFNYRYTNSQLSAVDLPDGSRWTFALSGLTATDMSDMGQGANCDRPGTAPADDLVGTMTHPSGATGRFLMRYAYHGRTYVDQVCRRAPFYPNPPVGAVYPRLVISQTLQEKTITGPGMPGMTWRYQHGGPFGWNPCTGCADRKTVLVTEPDGQTKAYEFGVRWRVNEGQLLRVSEGWTGSSWQRTTSNRYRTAAGQAYPDQFGTSLLRNSDYLAARNRPLDQRVTTQQGATFTWEPAADAAGLDHRARPLRVTKASSLGYSKSETTTYFDHTALWVLGQVERVVDDAGRILTRNEFDNPSTALPSARYSFERLLERLEYHPEGTIKRRLDPLGRATVLSNYMRGLPQNVTHRDGSTASAVVNNLGKVATYTNEVNTSKSFGYDAMGRLAQISYPAEAGLQPHPVYSIFQQVPFDEHGLAAGHWRQIVTTGSAITHRWYDALWRVRLEQTWDNSDPANTSAMVEHRYDHDGKKLFQAYPQRSITPVGQTSLGTTWVFDGLDRVVQMRQSSELSQGDLVTTTEYLDGFLRRVTNPRGASSTFNFHAYDTPSESTIAGVLAPEGVWTAIYRNSFGQPDAISRGGQFGGAAQQATRRYVYDVHQRLCKTVEPESGATIQAYDAAGNVAWRASGQGATGNTGCDTDSVPPSAKVAFVYDARDRLQTTTFGDGQPGISRSYTPDGLLQQLVSSSFTWTYGYNNRRQLTQEALSVPAQLPGSGWNFSYEMNAYGHVASRTDPWGAVLYNPDALGRPTEVSGYASGIKHHPNGAVASYTLANGIAHQVSLNTRGLPREWRDVGVSLDVYDYDANGNTLAISDVQWGQHRSMGYDGLDRLTSASGVWGSGSYGYDALDNLRSSQVGSRSLVHAVDPASNRLTSLSGSLSLGFGYDANGNITQRGSQLFGFDIANRLRVAQGKAVYDYDGHGRRSWVVFANGSTQLNAYTGLGAAGRLMFSNHSSKGGTRYVYLGGKLIAEHSNLSGVRYSHTDALGSPVAWTNAAGQLLGARTRYEPYGGTALGDVPQSVGFTGHVNDADTGLVYMQQRYYDPIAGRFLSVDPVTTDEETGSSFNRYEYARNNPYKYTDPDGRDPWYKEPPPPPPPPPPAPTQTITIVGQRLPAPTAPAPTVTLPAAITVIRQATPWALLLTPSPLGAAACEMPGAGPCGMLSEGDDSAQAGRKKEPKAEEPDPVGGHRTNQRPSTKDKHQKGDERRRRDQGREKKDERMRY